MLYLPIIVSLFTIAFVCFLIKSIQKSSAGSPRLEEISRAIREGARAFLRREFRIMLPVFFLLSLLLGIISRGFLAPFIFLIGAGFSFLAGFIGMTVSTGTNARVANAAQYSFPKSFQLAFSGGEVMGFLVVGLGLLGVTLVWLFFKDTLLLLSFAFGASLTGLFMRVGGGIFTKSADIGADLVGKLEKEIPEDDPRNPAVIADAVGDNVGDIAGMGSDLFESYVASIIAAMIIGLPLFGLKGLFLPLILASAGILSSILGSFFIKVSSKLNQTEFLTQTQQIRKAMERGIILSNILMIISAYFLISRFFGNINLFWAYLSGLIVGLLINKVTEYYTSEKRKPVLRIVKASKSGPSPVIVEGLAVGMESAFLPVIGVAIATVSAFYFAGFYGIAVAALGILGILGINLSTDCYGPIADNAAGISQMAGLEKTVRQRTEALDTVGNTTAATGKGFAMGSAALVALAWLSTYFSLSNLQVASLLDSKVIAGLFIGAALPFLFSSLLMKAVGKGALEVVEEVRRQFREISGLMEGTTKPEYGKCVDLTTKRALKEMLLPGILVVLVPLLVAAFLGLEALVGVLAGSLISGFLLALFMANSGGAWDNAKKYIEAGHLGGKGSEAHKSSVIGDTVGDPLKDTAGPSLNILIKLVGLVALMLLPLFL